MDSNVGSSKGKKYSDNRAKEDVQCFYCDLKLRKDTLKRHTENRHKGQEPKLKYISDGISGLSNFGFSSQGIKKREDTVKIEESNFSSSLDQVESIIDNEIVSNVSLNKRPLNECVISETSKKMKVETLNVDILDLKLENFRENLKNTSSQCL